MTCLATSTVCSVILSILGNVGKPDFCVTILGCSERSQLALWFLPKQVQFPLACLVGLPFSSWLVVSLEGGRMEDGQKSS